MWQVALGLIDLGSNTGVIFYMSVPSLNNFSNIYKQAFLPYQTCLSCSPFQKMTNKKDFFFLLCAGKIQLLAIIPLLSPPWKNIWALAHYVCASIFFLMEKRFSFWTTDCLNTLQESYSIISKRRINIWDEWRKNAIHLAHILDKAFHKNVK